MSDAERVTELWDSLRWAEEAGITPEYERGYRHAEDDIKRKLDAILREWEGDG